MGPRQTLGSGDAAADLGHHARRLIARSLGRTRAFHVRGSGWSPVFGNGEIVFYQMNGFMLGTWRNPQLDKDTQRASAPTPSAYCLAHNVPSRSDVGPIIARPVAAGGRSCARPTIHVTAASWAI